MLHAAVLTAWPCAPRQPGEQTLRVALQSQPDEAPRPSIMTSAQPSPVQAAAASPPAAPPTKESPTGPPRHTVEHHNRQTRPKHERYAADRRPAHRDTAVPMKTAVRSASHDPAPAAMTTVHHPLSHTPRPPEPRLKRPTLAMLSQRPTPHAPAGRHASRASAPPLHAVAARLRRRLYRRLAADFDYPLIARVRGWEGMVTVGLRVEADGTLSHLHVIETSGYVILDENSLRTLRRIAHLPSAAGWLQGRHMDLILPVKYRLTEGE